MAEPFDPLAYENLAQSIIHALNKADIEDLDEVTPFTGVGIYAIYYTGPFPAYEILSSLNREKPGSQAIYIGKAAADSSQTGAELTHQNPNTRKLYERLRKHRKSIEAASNLEVEDFQVRVLTLTPTWVPLAEAIALRVHTPLWNSRISGFGINDPGKGRKDQARSLWDTLHPGRVYASGRPDKKNVEEITQDVIDHLRVFADGDPEGEMQAENQDPMLPIPFQEED